MPLFELNTDSIREIESTTLTAVGIREGDRLCP